MTYQEFLSDLQKLGSKPHKISKCLGARDAWKWVRKNKWEALRGSMCSSSLYGAVVDEVNKLIVEQLIEGHTITFPHQMGTLKLTATEAKVSYSDGKIKNNYRIDWKKTLNYWYKNPEAREQKQYIKKIQDYIYNILYIKNSARFKYRRFYQFRANRSLVKTLGKRIENEKLNALIY